jgi:hypothetical protein
MADYHWLHWLYARRQRDLSVEGPTFPTTGRPLKTEQRAQAPGTCEVYIRAGIPTCALCEEVERGGEGKNGPTKPRGPPVLLRLLGLV